MVPLRALSLLQCPLCGGRFKLENADLDARYIYRGNLRCACGEELPILDGILETGNLYTGAYDQPDLKRELHKGRFSWSCHLPGDAMQIAYMEAARMH